MELRDIKALIALMRENGLTELEVEDKKGKIRLVRTVDFAEEPAARPVPSQPRARPAPVRTSAPGPRDESPELGENQALIKSPMVGTFYRSPSPDAPSFVQEGDMVQKGQPLCIVEAMKMMNEIESDTAGRLVRILVENGQPVEYGQPLMIVEKGV
ncbi:MAG: acetyl-CoA carboxylase biotin carboxyl carrier protein [Candidatus Binataceae bacterium]